MAATPAPEPPLDIVAARTLDHYGRNAADFWRGTRDHDVTQNRDALLEAMQDRPRPRRILDFGCGPGRDLAAFRALGEAPVGLDGCPMFVQMARAHSGCDVWLQNFFQLELGRGEFDGIFANASLFHVPRALLAQVLSTLFDALTPGGVLFCSNPRSFDVDSEGWQGDRYGCHLTAESWRHVITAAGFVIESEFLRPAGRPAAEQPWLAMVCRR